MPEVQLPAAAAAAATADLSHQLLLGKTERGGGDVSASCRLPVLLVKGFQLPRTTLAFKCTVGKHTLFIYMCVYLLPKFINMFTVLHNLKKIQKLEYLVLYNTSANIYANI